MKPIYIKLSNYTGKIKSTFGFPSDEDVKFYIDVAGKKAVVVGIEILNYKSIEIDGRVIEAKG